ncbi:hypothetical protein [Tautonia sociabilis]|uniref:Uncharacterized protein n=1 Tax=Tautonia sociabilis TaxID=2080755 RepID=A0A432MHV1_9BACT|nr:hypothetical protein [Tautonia sociabilis]RUL86933.1 hypothetical protein TsocGM_14920 [Tautonia sociabilis]
MTTLAPSTAPGPAPWRALRRCGGPALAAVALALLSAGEADAQFGFGGYGWGYGAFLHPYTPPSVSTLDRIAVTRAGMDQEALNRTSLSTPDRFDYRRQQVALQQRYDVQSMQGIDVDRRGRGTPIPGSRPAPGAVDNAAEPGAPEAPSVPRPVLSVSSFVNDNGQVVWPADAPISGDLADQRDRADAAIKEVVDEERAMGYSRISTVASARQALLDYGQPALQFVRETSTPRVADTFHLFLLSLYDALAQAAERGASRTGGPPPPP